MHPHPARVHVRMMTAMIRPWLVALLALTAVAHAADIGISPSRLELRARPGDTVSTVITVLKTSGSDQQVATEIDDWTLDVAGEIAFREAGSLDHSASPWLTVDVPEFVLAPGSTQQEVRVEVAVPADASLAGTYHSVLFFTVVAAPEDTGPVGVTTTTRVGLIVYVTIEDTEQVEVELADFYDVDETTLALVVANVGNTMVRVGGVVELRNEEGDLVRSLPLPQVPVMRDAEREVRLALPDDLEPGFYVALALVDDGRGDLLVGELLLDLP